MSDLNPIIDADDLENLKRQLAYTFLDAYGNFDGADILFDAIVKATEKRNIKLIEDFAQKEWDRLRQPYSKIMDQADYGYYDGILAASTLIKGEQK